MSKRKTNEDFLKELSIVNPAIDALDEYTANDIKITCRCKIDGYEWLALPTNLLRGEGCPKCRGVKLSKLFSKSHDDFVQQIALLNSNIEIIGRYKNNKTKIKCKCKIDGYEWYALPSHLLRGVGCPVCSNRIIVPGINDIATTHPEFVQYFKNKNDANTYSFGSGAKVDLICPDCGNEKRMAICTLIKCGFACSKCGDGVSYPNKFLRAMIDQLNIDSVNYEWSDVWSKPYKYDNYFIVDGNKYIVEADGGWHYKDNKLSGMSADEARRIDKLKEILATTHGISVVRIDCRESNKNYISKNIIASNLSDIFDLSSVDWNLCDKNACKNLIKEVCKIYQENCYDIDYLSSLFHLHKRTIQNYLIKGNEIGWCKYSLRKAKRSIDVFDLQNKKLHTFESILKCTNEMSSIYNIKFTYGCIVNACNNLNSYNGFVFKWV